MTTQQCHFDYAGAMQVVDVRWYAVHCVAMMNQLVCPVGLAIAASRFCS